jgi:hypothetical protein
MKCPLQKAAPTFHTSLPEPTRPRHTKVPHTVPRHWVRQPGQNDKMEEYNPVLGCFRGLEKLEILEDP